MIDRLLNRRAPLLPRDAGGEAWLASLIAVLCFLACLSAVGAVSADRAAHGGARPAGPHSPRQRRNPWPGAGRGGSGRQRR